MPDPITVLFLALTVVILPAFAIRGKTLLDRVTALPRIPLYIETIVIQLVLLILSIVVCRNLGLTPLSSGELRFRDWLAATILFSIAVVAMSIAWKVSDAADRRFLNMLIPRTKVQTMLWTVVSLAAGFGEELTYRAALPGLLISFGVPTVASALLSSAIFGLAHAVQGWKNTIIIFVAGLILHGLVTMTGTLWLAIAVHFLYDLAAGLILSQVSEEESSKDFVPHATV